MEGRKEGWKERSCELMVTQRINVQMVTFGTVHFFISVYFFVLFSNYSLSAHVVSEHALNKKKVTLSD